MRAVYLEEEFENAQEIILEGQQFHHLINVVRAKIGEELILLNGKGISANATIISINKKMAHLQIDSSLKQIPKSNLTIALCLPKRDALDLSIKQAVEIGVQKTILVASDFSVNKLVKLDRLERIIESAMEQSNNAYKMKLEITQSLNNINYDQFDQVYCLSSQDSSSKELHYNQSSRILLIIGPEGGFSNEEREFLNSTSKIQTILLNTHILRTPTALAVGCGHILSNCRND